MTTQIATDKAQWDEFMIRNGGGFLQSWDWSLFQQALGRKTLRYRLDAKDAPAGENPIAQFTYVELPLPLGQRYGYVPRGPVIGMHGNAEAVRGRFDAAVVALRELAAHQHDAFVRVEWPLPLGSEPGAAVVTEQLFKNHGFARAGHVQPEHTSIVDLDASEDELLAKMHQKTRYNIRVAEKHGVVVVESHDTEVFWKLLAETAVRDGFHTHERSYYEKMLTMFGEHSEPDNTGLHIRLWLAMYQDRAIASALTAEFGDTVTYLHGASRGEERKVMAPNLLHWEIIRNAKARGYRHYDFWGVAPSDDPTHPWAGISRFKTGFGGRFASYLGAWELRGNKVWYALYRLAKRLRR